MYEDLVVQNGWDIFEETYWVEFLNFRLEGEARKIFENWTLEDPSIRGDYQKVKKSFPGKFGVEDNVWKRMLDYELCRMKPDETIEAYNGRFQALASSLTPEEKEVIKYYHSMSKEAQAVLSEFSGEWPTTLPEIGKLAKEMMARNRIHQYAKKPLVSSFKTATTLAAEKGEVPKKPMTCFICQEKGHISFYCPKKTLKNNNIKETNSSYLPVYMSISLCTSEKTESGRDLVDSGASSNCISQELAEKLNVFRIKLKEPKRMFLATKSNTISIKLKTEVEKMMIGDHEELVDFFIIPELQEEVILGKKWLSTHNPMIDWVSDKVTFDKCQCSEKISVVKKQDGPEDSNRETCLFHHHHL